MPREGFSLRILQVIHQFPPHSSQGSEVYCYNLSRALAASDEVRVFHIANGARRWPRRLERDVFDGLSIYHCIDGGEYARVADWPNPFLQRTFRSVLDDYRPQIVHFHNYLSLGDDLVGMAREAGAAVPYTLHDFGLICPNALLLRDDGQLCDKNQPDFFAHCCPFLIRTDGRPRQTSPRYAMLPSMARWLLFSRQHPHRAVRLLLRAGAGLATRALGSPATTHVDRKRDFFFTQTRKIFAAANLFLAPSEFLLQRYIACGVDPDKIVHLPYGMRHFARRERTVASTPVRFGYIGALHPHKGIDILLQAFRGLGDRAALHVYGSAFGSPISEGYWDRIRAQAGPAVTFHGAYENAAIGAILADLDVVVVPSRWYENAPLTIQEAFIAGVPVITANAGGMAELVRDGIDGLHFRLGDAADLHQRLQEITDRPEMLVKLRSGIPPICEIGAHSDAVRARYQRLVALHAGGHP